MHARELIEFAALLASYGSLLVEQLHETPLSAADGYWSASKCRLERWLRAIKAYSVEAQGRPNQRPGEAWRQVRPVLEEILLSEVLTRVWVAASAASDRLRRSSEWEPIARSVFIGHLEARSRALNLMVYGHGFAFEEAVLLNRLRRRCERWTDLLLGCFLPSEHLDDLLFDSDRSRQFAQERWQCRQRGLTAVDDLLRVTLRAVFQQHVSPVSPNRDLNQQIAASLLQCLPPHLFSDTGLPHSLWLMRLTHTTADTQGLLEELLALDEPFGMRRSAHRRI